MVDLVKVRRKAKEKRAPQTPVPTTTAQEKLEQFLATAGEQRKWRKAAVVEPAKPQVELLTFDVAGELYAIDIENVVEIVTIRPITRVPNAGASIVGILSLRGMIVTVIDVRQLLGHPTAEAGGADARIIVVQHDGEPHGFAVDRVVRVVKIDSDSVESHPVVHTSEQDESVRGVFRLSGALTILLDLEKLLGGVAAWN